MPLITVQMIEGRTEEQKRDLIKALTNAAIDSIGAPPDSIRVMLQEFPKENFGIAGSTAKELGR